MAREEEASAKEEEGLPPASRAHLELEMSLGAEPIAGSLLLPAIERRWEFQGWIALAGALEAALEEAAAANRSERGSGER